MDTPNFPEWFHSVNSHMFLSNISETSHSLMPPNQRDWMYTLDKVNDLKWFVHGEKNDDYIEEIKRVYVYIKKKWTYYDA